MSSWKDEKALFGINDLPRDKLYFYYLLLAFGSIYFNYIIRTKIKNAEYSKNFKALMQFFYGNCIVFSAGIIVVAIVILASMTYSGGGIQATFDILSIVFSFSAFLFQLLFIVMPLDSYLRRLCRSYVKSKKAPWLLGTAAVIGAIIITGFGIVHGDVFSCVLMKDCPLFESTTEQVDRTMFNIRLALVVLQAIIPSSLYFMDSFEHRQQPQKQPHMAPNLVMSIAFNVYYLFLFTLGTSKLANTTWQLANIIMLPAFAIVPPAIWIITLHFESKTLLRRPQPQNRERELVGAGYGATVTPASQNL